VIDVFIRHFTDCPDLRGLMYGLCSSVWESYPNRVTTMVEDKGQTDFHIRSKANAETLSETEIYVVTDDDCLPLGDDFIERGAAILQHHPEYGILTATSVCDGPFPSGKQLPDTDVVEMHAVGGVSFVRKGILKKFDLCSPDQVDDCICTEVNRAGYLTGVMPHVRFIHVGMWRSIYQRFAQKESQ
jgi:hypothetical protein